MENEMRKLIFTLLLASTPAYAVTGTDIIAAKWILILLIAAPFVMWYIFKRGFTAVYWWVYWKIKDNRNRKAKQKHDY
jgi:hypothetical protein